MGAAETLQLLMDGFFSHRMNEDFSALCRRIEGGGECE